MKPTMSNSPESGAADPTSGSVREEWIIKRGAADIWRGTLVVPAEAPWMIERIRRDALVASIRRVTLVVTDEAGGVIK